MPKTELFDKEAVLDSAMHLFWKKGYHATSMQDLVEAMGINRSSIYNTFGDKFALYLESLKRYQSKESSQAHHYLLQSQSPLEAITKFIEGIVGAILADKDKVGCYISNCTTEFAHTDSPVRKFLNENQNNLRQLFKDILTKGQETGEISTRQSPDALALYLFSSIQGLRLTGMIIDDRRLLHTLTDSILAALK